MDNYEINEKVREIKKNEKQVLNNKNIKESIDVYCFLSEEFKKGNIKNNYIFQFMFRSFYRLDNAGLSDGQKKCFFELLEVKEKDMKKILSELYNIPTKRNLKTIQFSFTTKLLHTLDNNKPIYDSFVGDFLKLKRKGTDKEEKIESCLSIYKTMEYCCNELLKSKEIKQIIKNFREKFNLKEKEITDMKILDFIIWSYKKK